MAKSKKGILTKTILVEDPDGFNDVEVYVTYSWYNEEKDMDDYYEESYITRDDIDIKHYESNTDEELPEWLTIDLVYDSLIEDIEDDLFDDSDDVEEWNGGEDDFDDTDDVSDENW
jgi:hypothetical protein